MDRICYLVFGVKIPFYLQYALPLLVLYNFLSRLISNKYFRVFLILVPPAVIIVRLLRNDPFFLSDDFAHLRLVNENSYLDLARMAFSGGGIWVGHRIIGAFWLFKAIFQLFGVKTEAFIAANFILHSANVLLFYLITQKLKKTSVTILTAFILGSFYLTWISNMHEIMGATFALLTTLFWVKWLSGQKKAYLLAIVFYIMAIFTKEITFLLPISLGFITVFYNYHATQIEKDKIVRHLIPFAAIFLVYLFTYGASFLNYRTLPSQDSYKIGINLASIAENLRFYGGYTFPIAKSSLIALVLIFSSFIIFDLAKKIPIMIPFLISFFSFLGPALLFEKRVSYYYSYIATFFLFIGLTFFLDEAHSVVKNLLKNRPKFWLKIFNIYLVLFLTIAVFRVDKALMDNCFLIQYPWKNEHKTLITRIAARIEELIGKGVIEEGTEIALANDEATPEMELVYEGQLLPLFMESGEGKKIELIFNKDKSSLLVEEFSEP